MKTRKKYISSRFSVEIQKKSSASRMNAPKGGEQKKTQHNNEHWIEVWLWFIFNSQYVFNIYSLNVLLI